MEINDPNSRQKRYTDDDYLSPKGVSEAIGFSAVDFIWKDIKLYREQKKKLLPLYSPSRNQFFYTGLDSVNEKLAAGENSLAEFIRQYKTVSAFKETKEEADRICYLRNLSRASTLYKADVNELTIKAMLNGMFAEEDKRKRGIFGYKKLLDALQQTVEKSPDQESFLAESLQKILGSEELVRFYRETDQKTYMTDSYSAASPARLIPDLMDSLWKFLDKSGLSVLMNTLIAIYWVSYVQPFESKEESNLLAVALGRYVLSTSGLSVIANVLPLEETLIFTPHFEKYEDTEIRRSGDLTYFLLYATAALKKAIAELLDAFQRINNTAIEREYREIPKSEISSLKEEEPKPVSAPKKEPTRLMDESIEDAEDYDLPEETGALSFSAPRQSSRTDKEVKEMARYLLETHPRLRKAQANFYANHCVLGRYYTIQDFKRSVRCAYETARTSMDLLADEGLYKKLKIKNKYVYTPLKQGE